MVKFSVGRAYPSAKELLGQIPSSHGEFTVQFDTRTLRQQSMSMPSRMVSMSRLSIVRLSTPVASTPNHPPSRILKSRSSTSRQFFKAMVLLPTPGLVSSGRSASFSHPRLSPLPQINPGPVIETPSSPSPQSSELCQWLCPKSW